MARKAMIEKQKRRVACAEKYRQRRMDLLEKSKDMSISEQERELARIGLQKLPKNSSRTRLRNRCQLTGRSRGFLRRFKVSRICLRELAGMGLVPGLLKASW